MWKHVKPNPTSFAWLSPELAKIICGAVLQKDGTRDYGNFGAAHLGLGRHFSARFFIPDLFYLGALGVGCVQMKPSLLFLLKIGLPG